ncbi:ATP-binding cassette domain-containing protein [Variovorax defluvii]|uniref:ATP-binding cassette domain-containing protein n=1 Tax=Variovorax defluvii TaxID=913761 RepID=A0ABP8GWE8_9BURK
MPDAAGAETPGLPSPRLQVRALRSSFGGPFELALGRGECVCIVGRSGSGKSVLLRLIADLDPGTGEVSLDGTPREHWSAPAWRRRVVYQPAEPAWWAPRAGDHFQGGDAVLVQASMQRLGLVPALLDAEVDRLSTGERLRLALVRSLAIGPRVLLLDEPTAALDEASVASVETLLRERLAQGLSLLIVTHAQEQARRMGARVFEMVSGRLYPR